MTNPIAQQNFAELLSPFVFKNGITVRNRIAMTAMTHYSSNEDGTLTQEELDYVRRRSGGAGLVFTACVSVHQPRLFWMASGKASGLE